MRQRAHCSLCAGGKILLGHCSCMFCNNLSRGQAGDKLVKHVSTKLLDDLVEHIDSANINWGGAVTCEVVWVPTAETPTASRVPGTGTVDVHRDRRWKWRCSSPVGWSSSVGRII